MLGVVALALGAAACTVGSGAGSASGDLFVVGCDKYNDYATPSMFSLNPTFFAGEPIEDVCPVPLTCMGPHMNRLVIRLQRTGNGVEVVDTLYFDVKNSLQVALCLQGKLNNGQPTWDTRLVTAPDGSTIPNLRWCDWTAHADGGAGDAGAFDAGSADAAAGDAGAPFVKTAAYPRINLSTQDYVRASLDPLGSCDEARAVGVALPGSWIEFQNFGSAEDSNTTPSNDFKVNFGERLRANFHLILGDQAVDYAIQNHYAVPPSRIGGALDGYFDFDLQRGRAAQPFP
ncbi:MAG TPA: hypothetical protein VH560_01575 [Polyangia bacterium]|jgi:hypothetical protein|nr:hypothetical protein [Polyangia bacterium]